METVAVASSRHQAARKLVNNKYLAVLYDIIHIDLE